jgi:hypothetical protein
MKNPINIILASVAVVVLAAGCNKSDQGTSTPPTEMNKGADKAATAPAPAPPPPPAAPAPTPPAPADNAAPATPPPAAADTKTQADPDVAKNQSVLDSAKQLLADNKPADALKALNDLVVAKLTPAQQTTFESLKRQAQALIEKLASSNAAGKASDAVGGLLKK